MAHDAPTGYGKTSQIKSEIVQFLKAGFSVLYCNPHFIPVSANGEDWRPIGKAIEAQDGVEIQAGKRINGILRRYEDILKILKWLSRSEID